jgi:predicted nucleic acid-binding protein
LIYYDSSALLKLVLHQRESEDFQRWYEARQRVVAVSSSLALVEVVRAVGQDGPAMKERARAVLAGLDLMPMTYDLLGEAGELGHSVRSLDAIHLVSAIRLKRDLQAFVAYDKRLLQAAEEAGLPIASPGAS